MAGIGFELRKLLRSESYFGLLRAYGYAGLIGSGPWIFSIVGLLSIGILSAGAGAAALQVDSFLVSVTYLMASSLIFAGALQLFFGRFVADRLYSRETGSVLPNLLGAITLTHFASGAVGAATVAFAFQGPLSYRLLMLACFVVLCDLWLLVVMLSGLKQYRAVLGIYFGGYALVVALSLAMRPFGIAGLLGAFLAGQSWMLLACFALVVARFPAGDPVRFDFLRPSQRHLDLALTGLLYNLGFWVDKAIFWFTPAVSKPVIGPLRASIIYDLPMFLAYLSIVPGMAVFLVRIETDFAELNEAFYRSIREGATLGEIESAKIGLVASVRRAISEIFKVQGLAVLVFIFYGKDILAWLGLSPLHAGLYNLDILSVFLQLVLLAVLNVLFYLDQRRTALILTAVLAASNALFTSLTILAGPRWYGYGLAGAALVSVLLGLSLLSRKLERLEYETFMLQPA
jgi:uncharacterized membrane protein